MAIGAAIQREWGWYLSASGGTGNVYAVSGTAGQIQPLRICGIACGESATNDVVTVLDGNGNTVYSNVGGTLGGLVALNLAAPIRVTGLNVTFAGGTNGQCFIYTPGGNY